MKYDEYSHASIDHPERNEDAYLIFTGENGKYAPVFAVIDGMGGHQHKDEEGKLITGHDASQTLRQVILDKLCDLPSDVSANQDDLAEERLLSTFAHANEALFKAFNEEQAAHENRVGAVLTIAVLCENGKRLLIGQVGDTRAYLWSAGDLIQLCEDEDNVSYLVQSGILSEEDGHKISLILNSFDGINEPQTSETVNIFGQDYDLYLVWRWFIHGNPALNIPGANAVISALGIDEECPYPQTSRMEVDAGDALFMVSDGIYKNLTDAELMKALSSATPAQEAGDAALARSQDGFNRRSTKDDMTAIFASFD